MTPQPLSRVRSRVKVLCTPDAISLRPKLSPLVAEVIARWADIEVNVGSILTFLLHTEASPVMAMLEAIRSSSAQFDMIRAAADAKLIDPELETFQAVLKMAGSAANKRHEIAHHVWAYCEELPDALLLVEPSAYHDIFVAVQDIMRNPNSRHADDPRLEPDNQRTRVYRENDFLEIIAEMKVVAKCTTFLINYLHGQHPARAEIYNWLSAEPAFQTALIAVRASRQRKEAL